MPKEQVGSTIIEKSAHQKELSVDQTVIDVLRGTISEPVTTISYKPGHEGQEVVVRLVQEGAGQYGLTDWQDNREWAGIFGHAVLTARYATHVAQMLEKNGNTEVNPQRLLNALVASHLGRRKWDEAGWDKDAIPQGEEIRKISNETLGMQIAEGKIPQDAFEIVVALGHNVEGFSVDPDIYNSLDFRLAMYFDHRITQGYERLNERLGAFLIGNFGIDKQQTQYVYDEIAGIVADYKKDHAGKLVLDTEVMQRLTEVTDARLERLGAKPDSSRLSRKKFAELILMDAGTETYLEAQGIHPDEFNDINVPMPKWERELKKGYLASAVLSLQKERHEDETVEAFLARIEKGFNPVPWWGEFVKQALSENSENQST